MARVSPAGSGAVRNFGAWFVCEGRKDLGSLAVNRVDEAVSNLWRTRGLAGGYGALQVAILLGVTKRNALVSLHLVRLFLGSLVVAGSCLQGHLSS